MKGFFLKRPLVELADEDFFIRLVRDAFAQRRKMLINNLKKSKLLVGFSDVDLKEALDAAGIDGQRRGETLSVEEFGYLSNILKESNKT
jgi:16S rRNA (adenine1518-N6/adenine1519-N6)-dimethyltransferase